MDYVVGPPAVAFFQNGKQYAGFAGYSPGFTTFELAPAAGQYSLSALVAASNVAPVTYTATANLTSTTPLGPTAVTFASDANGDGGGTGTVTIPPGVTEAEVFIVDLKSYSFFTVKLTGTAPGTASYALPANLGSCGTNCPQPTLVTGDPLLIASVGYDYPATEASDPTSTSQKPTITGANGQADITMSPIVSQNY